jgi:riboflavin kinase/FMN adenylyltransferase
MDIINYKSKCEKPVILLLGFFDCLHQGHRKLIEEAKKIGFDTAIFTFTDKFYLKDEKVVYTFFERLKVFEKAGLDCVIYADFDDNFKNTPSEVFLNTLNDNFLLKGIVCGYDYKFGKNTAGNVATIRKFCENNNITCNILEKIDFDGEKAASSAVKNLLKNGKIERANLLLSDDYFISGIVEEGRKIGRTLGFPTANLNFDNHKSEIKEGVYKVYSFIDGIKYYGICNYGNKPTFNINARTIEIYYKNYSGDLYGKNIEVYFIGFIRDIIKFSNIEALKIQIEKDLRSLND